MSKQFARARLHHRGRVNFEHINRAALAKIVFADPARLVWRRRQTRRIIRRLSLLPSPCDTLGEVAFAHQAPAGP